MNIQSHENQLKDTAPLNLWSLLFLQLVVFFLFNEDLRYLYDQNNSCLDIIILRTHPVFKGSPLKWSSEW